MQSSADVWKRSRSQFCIHVLKFLSHSHNFIMTHFHVLMLITFFLTGWFLQNFCYVTFVTSDICHINKIIGGGGCFCPGDFVQTGFLAPKFWLILVEVSWSSFRGPLLHIQKFGRVQILGQIWPPTPIWFDLLVEGIFAYPGTQKSSPRTPLFKNGTQNYIFPAGFLISTLTLSNLSLSLR